MKNKIIQNIRYYKPIILEEITDIHCSYHTKDFNNLKIALERSYFDSSGNIVFDVVSNKFSHLETIEIEWNSPLDIAIDSKIIINNKEYLINDKVYNLDNTITYYVEDYIKKIDNYDENFEKLCNELISRKKKKYKKLYTTIDSYYKRMWFDDIKIYKLKNNQNGKEYKIKYYELYKYENEYYWDGEFV